MHEIEKKLWRKIGRFSWVFRAVPFARMIAVCNSLTLGWVDEDSDIDLFVVAKSGRLFTVRAFLTLYLQVLGLRRHGKKVSGRFCLSFFIDDSVLDLEEIALSDDVYLANWLVSLMPLIDDGVSGEILNSNSWVKQLLKGGRKFEIDDSKCGKKSSLFSKCLEWSLNGVIGNLLEGILRRWQMKRAKGKMNSLAAGHGVIINEHVLKFHNVDRREEYRARF